MAIPLRPEDQRAAILIKDAQGTPGRRSSGRGPCDASGQPDEIDSPGAPMTSSRPSISTCSVLGPVEIDVVERSRRASWWRR